jgi:hypothetical protein
MTLIATAFTRLLSTGAHLVDIWMQAGFAIPKSQLGDNPYPTPDAFRLYFNPTGTGIPPHGSITVTLPLYTQLVPSNQVNTKLPDQYIDWWNGGRISIYASLYSTGAAESQPAQKFSRSHALLCVVCPSNASVLPSGDGIAQVLPLSQDRPLPQTCHIG